eukprot:g15400.t1
MKTWLKIVLIVGISIAVAGAGVGFYLYKYANFDIYVPVFASNCASCHGEDLLGTEGGPALVGRALEHGDTVAAMATFIASGHSGLTNYAEPLDAVAMKGLAIYIGERRLGQHFMDFRFDRSVELPAGVQTSQVHNFTIEPVAVNLDPLIFSIEPMPDGSFLLSEKERGLSIVSADGKQSDLITGTPLTGGSIDIRGIQYGSGWLLDVKKHPDYEENGWIYLHYTHICGERCPDTVMDASMNRLERGRIVDGAWVDVETIWEAPVEFYAQTPDTGAGGRIAFDDAGHVYIGVGIKSAEEGDRDTTPQDLQKPYGKIHRVRDNGDIPIDNPFAGDAQQPRTVQSIWTYGHRSPQGLEWNAGRGRVWNSEMGPRGGDELNELVAGGNYGWPYRSHGLEYSGHTVERHRNKAVEFDPSETHDTLVDITPSPAISSFAFYTGTQFPQWQGDVLIGSLKGSSLYRMAFDGRELIARETLVSDLARIRDVEIGYDGLVYLLLENKAGSMIVRLVPA